MSKIRFPKLSGATPNAKPSLLPAQASVHDAALGVASATLATAKDLKSGPLHIPTNPERFLGVGGGIAATLAERGSRYGDFTHHAELAQRLQDVMREYPGWDQCNPVQRQALTVIADKIARILSGDPNYADNWHDIQGYAKLVEERLPKE